MPVQPAIKQINLTLPDVSRKPKGPLVAPVSPSEAPVAEPMPTVETPPIVAPPTPESPPEANERVTEPEGDENIEPEDGSKPLTKTMKIVGAGLTSLGFVLFLPTAYGIGMLDADLYINTNPIFKDAAILLTTIMLAGAIMFGFGLFTLIPNPPKPTNSSSLVFKAINFGQKIQKPSPTNVNLTKKEPLEVALPSE